MPETDAAEAETDDGTEPEGAYGSSHHPAGRGRRRLGVGLATAQGLVVPSLQQKGLWSADGVFSASATTIGDVLLYIEAFPTSPLILEPFKDELVIPKALAPETDYQDWDLPPGPGEGQQNSMRNERHQMWSPEPDRIPGPDRVQDRRAGLDAQLHQLTGAADHQGGKPAISFDATGKTYPAGTVVRFRPAPSTGSTGSSPAR